MAELVQKSSSIVSNEDLYDQLNNSGDVLGSILASLINFKVWNREGITLSSL